MTSLHYPIAITGNIRIREGTQAAANAQRVLDMLTAMLRYNGLSVTAAVLGEPRSALPKADE